jgi:YD repeat-containing protein
MAVVQPPIRNTSGLGASVFGHSGEFGPTATDLRLPGRGLDLALVRSYRSSLAHQVGELGRGWSLNLAQRFERVGDDLVYHDGAGLAHRFVRNGQDGYASPPGFYGLIAVGGKELVILHRYGIGSRFDVPEEGGRLRSVEDRNGNAISLQYGADRIDVLDSFRRPLTVELDRDRIREIHDPAGRTWSYVYDHDDRLVEVVQPATRLFPDGTSQRCDYDGDHRLVALTDAKGQTWLTVRYDDAGRVVEQQHGSGTYTFEYEMPQRRRSSGLRTTCRLRNGGSLVVDHNRAGNPLTRTVSVRRDAFALGDVDELAGDVVPLVTTYAYNRDSELVELTEAAGNSMAWQYAEHDDPRNRGNCLRQTEKPAPDAPADQPELVTTWTHDPTFQLPLTVTDPRGNTTTHRYDERGNRIATAFPSVTIQSIGPDATRRQPASLAPEVAYAFNSRGQLLRKTNTDGTVTSYAYYPVVDPIGAGGPGTATNDPEAICGYLARVTFNANGGAHWNEFRWDEFGNVVAALDRRQNAAQRRYDAMGRLESVIGREPFADTTEYRYDPNGNEVESSQPFERLELDADAAEPVGRAGMLRELQEYNTLDNLVARTIAGGDARVTERFIRDDDERVVRLVQPNGTVTAFEYDERDLLITMTRAAGTREAVTERRAYTRNGALRTLTDGNGATTTLHYDGYQRYAGFTDPLGTTRAHELDQAGNVTRTAVGDDQDARLLDASYEYDQWDRVVRVDYAWRDGDGKPLGRSGWDGRDGVVSTVVEYGPDGRLARVWREGGSVTALTYDGLGRVTQIEEVTGESRSFAYDENGNPTEARYRGTAGPEPQAETIVDLRYDGMDRLVGRQVKDEAPERFEYDAFGGVAKHLRPSGMHVRLLQDALGRRVGQVLSTDGADGSDARQIARRLEFDEAYRLVAHTDGAGKRTLYRYDALDRQTAVVYPDGSEATAEYDASGNVVRTVDAAGTETVDRYDACDRLVERRTRLAGSDDAAVESFQYDAVGRLVRATAPGGEVGRTYDSLSRVLTEDQGRRTVRALYDAGGRPTRLDYPGGESIRRRFDAQGRVTAITTADGQPIAAVTYRAGEQVADLVVGGAIQARCTYDSRERLESVTYKRVDDGSLVEGYRYAHDDAGRIVHEIQASDGVGQRFWFDGFNRPVRARYGVADVLEPTSPFELETEYDWFPEGPWRRRRDTDGNGAVISDQAGSLDRRNRYTRLGETSFKYDPVGNVVRKGTDNPGFCLYTYDAANRLVKVECFDKNAQRTRTTEYEYDALGRLVRKVETDAAGVATETTYVWAGTTLIEEYENGVLVRTYVQSIGSQPARLTVENDGARTDYFYVHDGRGLVVGLVRANDPNVFAERYGYEVTGNPYLKQVAGVDVELPKRSVTASSVWNSVLSGDAFGSLMRDWATGTLTGGDGRHLDGSLAEVLNTDSALTGGVHTTIRTTMGKQFASLLGMLGLGSGGGFVSHGGGGGQTGSADAEGTMGSSNSGKSSGGADQSGSSSQWYPRDFSLYAAGADGGTGSPGWNDFKNATPPPVQDPKGGASSKDSRIQSVQDFLDKGIPGTGNTVSDAIAGGVKAAAAPLTHPEKDAPPAGSATSSGSGQTNAAAQRAKEQQEKEKEAKEMREKAAKEAAEKKTKEEEAAKKKSIVEEGDKYVDPDQQTYGPSGLWTEPFAADRIEMRLNGRKRPVNPNTDGGTQVDESSPPPHHGGIDPNVARYDGEVYGGASLEQAEMKISIRPMDFHRDREPPTPTSNPTGSGEADRHQGFPQG